MKSHASAERRRPAPPAGSGQATATGFGAIDPWVLVALAIVAAAWIVFRVRTGIILEDALITYRHAENLALGRGFGFNPGERVLGTTSPLLTLLLAALARVWGTPAIPLLSNVLMMSSALGATFLASRLFARGGASRMQVVLVVLLLGLHPDVVWSSAGGLETPLVLLLMTWGLHATFRERWTEAAVACGFALLARVDAGVWCLILLGVAMVRLRVAVLRPVAAGLAVVAPWLVFSQAYFGSFLPHSMVAKHVIGADALNVAYLPWMMNSLGVTFVRDMTPFEFPVWLLFLCAGAASILGGPKLRHWTPVVLHPVLFGVALWLGRAPMFEWYTVPSTWCCLLVAVHGSCAIADVLRTYGVSRAWGARTPGRILLVAWAVVTVGLAARLAGAEASQRANQENENSARRAVGEWLRSHARTNASVAMEAIGYQGTFSGLRVIDLAGIVSPEVVRLERETGSNARAFDRLIASWAPEYVVLRAIEVETNHSYYGGPLFETAAARDRFFDRYRQVFQVTAPHAELWGVNARILVFGRDETRR